MAKRKNGKRLMTKTERKSMGMYARQLKAGKKLYDKFIDHQSKIRKKQRKLINRAQARKVARRRA